jgi:hypothetical protein
MHRWINSTKLQSVICESLPPCHPWRSCSKSSWTSCLILWHCFKLTDWQPPDAYVWSG